MKKIDQDFVDTFIEINEAARTDEAIKRTTRSMIDDALKGTSFYNPGNWSIRYN